MFPWLYRSILHLALWASAPAVAAGHDVVVIAAQHTPGLTAFTERLSEALPDDRVRLATPAAAEASSSLPTNTRWVLIGPEALGWRLQRPSSPPTLVLQVNQVDAPVPATRPSDSPLTLLWHDAAPERQLSLIRLILPIAHDVSVLYGEASQSLVAAMRVPAQRLGLTLHAQRWDDPKNNRALARALQAGDVLLGVNDPALYNARTIKSVLLLAYGQRKALIGSTGAFIPAGALATTVSTPDDWIKVAADYLRKPAHTWPATAYPHHYRVITNPQVSRAMGLDLPSDAELSRQLQQRLPTSPSER